MIPMKPATMAAAAEAYRKSARFHTMVQMIVAEEMVLADRALREVERDPGGGVRETVSYLATSIAARVLQTIYDNDVELKEWKALAERFQAAAINLNTLSPPPPMVTEVQRPIPAGAHVETVFEVRVQADLKGALRAVLTTRLLRAASEITGQQVLVVGRQEVVGP